MNNSQISKAMQECISLIEQKRYLDAIHSLKLQIEHEPNAEMFALLGLTYFHNEQYPLAMEAYQKALDMDPSNIEWNQMMQKLKANALTEVNIPIPDVYHFEREKLLMKPIVGIGSIPIDPLPAHVANPRLKNIELFLGQASGSISTFFFELLVKTWGSLVGTSGKIWTNWYRRPLMLGILTLAYMREKLNKNNLKSTYPKGSLVGFQEAGQKPPEGVQYYRTADGSWNNLENPKEGAAGTRFARNIQIDAVIPETGSHLLTPNPREISLKLLSREGEMKEVPFLNMLAACWIQFQNADWINHGENNLKELIEVPLSENDPARKKFLQTKMFIPRTQADPTRMEGKEEVATSFINEVTHWWDGSQIYGSDQETVDRLRSGVDGKLNVNPDGTLPLDQKGIEQTGFVRNWWVGMTLLHTLFTREHNAICDHLKLHYADWDDTRIFNVARLINAATMAKIHSVEWTPAILANQGLDTALNANWYGILTNLFTKGKQLKTVSQINVRNPELGGVVGNPINKHGVHFAFTQEFVEVYRLHSLLPEKLQLKKFSTGEKIMDLPFPETRQSGAAKLTKQVPLVDLFYSFGNQHPGQLVLHNYPQFMQELSIPFNPVFDMGAVDIIRARERGVPRYNEFRRQLGLLPIKTFEDLTEDPKIIQELKDVYGHHSEAVELLDLLVGTLSEGHRPDGFGFGETMFQIFILNATRRLQSDRFYTDCYTEAYYTKEGMAWIDNSDLKTIILRHYPELANSGLGNIKNAFEPWDTDKNLNPSRHPLRAWDKTLKNGPWIGDAN
ncbi:MAG: peroxidase [Saprospiraceae bacterium]|nr:peroxidase [Saprospiraceae bacterium]